VDYLCPACREHHDVVRRYLDELAVPSRESHRLVRGLDYYTRTTFEVLGESLGAQNALLGGGRYDGLVKQLGGPDRPGIGFAAGIERLVLALPDAVGASTGADVFVVAIGEEARTAAVVLLRDLRRAGFRAQMEYDGRSVKAQMKRADRLKAPLVVIVGGDELARGELTIKDMRSSTQVAVPRARIVHELRAATPAAPGSVQGGAARREQTA
jgi:histidyl-tRNA synthetase